MDFELLPEAQAHWHFNLRDREYPGVSLEGLHLHLIELPKAARQAATGATGLADWISYFEHWQEDSVMQDIQHPPVKDALERLQGLSNDTEERYRALARERALLDEAFYMDGARMEGGRAILTKQLNLKFGALPTPAQQRLQAASASELEQWSERILFAETLEDIFAPA
ncbi:PD-(D/E)XK nuclease family transposase [Pseudomonas sp. ABC1]|uniref:PD-(D/E)XK nuclease family transposase n=1 Tax=Pseudomonas sp. ABC1 TaxID=2748080 RepID=UPI0015C322D4|nr:PD-(D/E)XK nuclease family transposase [Pseudomonas sp. ABC1]QLF93353.1 PD-(D/E)XK nuclease family transposase [Pseudomonas sp. ABC1]